MKLNHLILLTKLLELLAYCGGLRRSNHQQLTLLINNHEHRITQRTNIKEWTNMPPISEELYNELVKEFNNQKTVFFNDSYNLED